MERGPSLVDDVTAHDAPFMFAVAAKSIVLHFFTGDLPRVICAVKSSIPKKRPSHDLLPFKTSMQWQLHELPVLLLRI